MRNNTNWWKYQGDSRYEKVYEQMQLLGIQDVTTDRQYKNGTIVWRLPILSDNPSKYIEYASFKSGYVRNQGVDCHSNWQINKRKMSEPMYYAEKWFAESDKREEASRIHGRAVQAMQKLDKEKGILTGNSDGLD